jgi:hypothetical protein
MTTTETGATVEKSYRCAIQTKFHPNTRSISVWSYAHEGKRVRLSWNDALDVADNHAGAVRAYLDRMEWSGRWVIGASPCQTGYVAVWGGE